MDLETILASARTVASDVLAPRAAQVDAEACWPEAGMRALLDAGLGGLTVPRRNGGLGQGLRGLVNVCETLAQACPSTAMCFGMHLVGSAVIAAKVTPEQERALLGPIVRGEHITTLALSEYGTGAQFYFPQTRAERIADGYRVVGQKAFVTNGGHADSYVLSVVDAASESDVGEFSCVALPSDAEGIQWQAPWLGMGMRGNASRAMVLDGVRVPAANLLGREGDQLWYVFEIVTPYFLMAMTGTYLGVAEHAVQELSGHLRRRRHEHDSISLAQRQLIQHRLGVLWSRVERTRRLAYHAAAEFDAGKPEALPALLASKAEVADCCVEVTNQAMGLAGGSAYGENGVFARLLRDARASHVMAPTTDQLRVWIGRQLLGEPLLGDGAA